MKQEFHVSLLAKLGVAVPLLALIHCLTTTAYFKVENGLISGGYRWFGCIEGEDFRVRQADVVRFERRTFVHDTRSRLSAQECMLKLRDGKTVRLLFQKGPGTFLDDNAVCYPYLVMDAVAMALARGSGEVSGLPYFPLAWVILVFQLIFTCLAIKEFINVRALNRIVAKIKGAQPGKVRCE